MEPEQLLTLAVGAFFGAAGWLIVGLYMQRRQHEREARSAARAVYFELAMNQVDIGVAAEHGVYQPLRRSAFDRLLPELATWLDADQLATIVAAYMSQAGYDQAQRDDSCPLPCESRSWRAFAESIARRASSSDSARSHRAKRHA